MTHRVIIGWFTRALDWRWSQLVLMAVASPFYLWAPKPWQLAASLVWISISSVQMVRAWRQIRVSKRRMMEARALFEASVTALQADMAALDEELDARDRKEHPEWLN